MNAAGIYAITNTTNGKAYVGSAVNLGRRLKYHRDCLRRGTHFNAHLQSSWKKYGAEKFVLRPLLICVEKDLLLYEQRAINAYRADGLAYNTRHVANSNVGLKYGPVPEERRLRIAASNRGIKKPPNKNTLGMKHSEVTKEKMRASHAAREIYFSPEVRAKISAANIGRKQSDEAKEKNAVAHRGKKHTAEWCEMMSQKMTGRVMQPFTDEHRKNLSIAARNRKTRGTRGKSDRDGRGVSGNSSTKL